MSALHRVTAPSTPLRREPRPDAPLDTEALAGEGFSVFEEAEGWARGRLETDGYEGWVAAHSLGDGGPAPTHRVAALRTFLYPGPDMKRPAVAALSFRAGVTVTGAATTRALDYALLADGSAVVARHLVPVDAFEADFVAVAERFVGTPYLWGGRTSVGLDCSALVQLALAAAGIAAPRDSGDQEQVAGTAVPFDGDRPEVRRGDLLFWPGHVAIAMDPDAIVHASGFHMAVVVEPLAGAVARIAAGGVKVRSVRRVG